MAGELLGVNNLTVQFNTDIGCLTAVDDITFTIKEGEVLGLVGESGCGKSVTALSIMGLLIGSSGRVSKGTINFEGENLLSKSESDMRKIRGNRISMVFQEPMTSLNPVLTVGDQVAEAVTLHQNVNRLQAKNKVISLLQSVEIPSPERRLGEYPHQLSGGMRQRVMIAMALASNPRLLIADEPTTALDVTIQAQILDLMRQLRAELGTAILLITHDLGVIAEMADRIAVMYAGQIVEIANIDTLFKTPAHPYTVGLLASVPRIDGLKDRLDTIDGTVPPLSNIPSGCRFNERCKYADKKCCSEQPDLVELSPDHMVRCLKAPVTEDQ